MVYQQQPIQQPVAQPYGTSVPVAQPYGAPPAGAVMPQPDVKWSGLSTGGAFKIPVICFIGRLTEMVYDTQSQFGLRIIEKYDQVQILESPVPWPWATLDLSVKYSEKESSGWGRHVASAKTLGLAVNATNLDEAKADLVGKMFELRQQDESYGEDQKTGQAFHGDVWRFVRIVSLTGAPAPAPQAQYVAPAPVVAPQPVAVAPVPQVPLAPAPAPTPVVTPVPAPVPIVAQPVAPLAPAVAAPVAPTGVFNTAIAPSDTAPIRAKKLLHNKALNEFLGAALIDDIIKADTAFVGSIYDQSFIVGLKASGQATLGTDGRFTITS